MHDTDRPGGAVRVQPRGVPARVGDDRHHERVLARRGEQVVRLFPDVDVDGCAPDLCHTPLTSACSEGKVGAVRALLRMGADVDLSNPADCADAAPLHYASTQGCPEVVRALLEHGAAVDARTRVDDGDTTPLMMASDHGHLGAVRVLVVAGRADTRLKNAWGLTALDIARKRASMACFAGMQRLHDTVRFLESCQQPTRN